MEVSMTGSPNASVSTHGDHKEHPKEGRNVWIVTVYTISGLAFFGVLAYYISTYFAK
jgi:hypothetical protein